MMLRLGVDFGSSGTVIALYDTVTGAITGGPFFFENCVKYPDDESGGRITTSAHPTLLHDWIARHLRHHILRNSPQRIMTENGPLTYREAGKDYLKSCIRITATAAGNTPVQEIVFSLPEKAPPHYSEWIASVAEGAGFTAYRTIGEMTAASTGYGISVPPNHTVMVIDSGADSFSASIGCPVRDQDGSPVSFRIIGHAAADTGGRIVDTWLADRYLPGRHGVGCRNSGKENRDRLLESFRLAKEALSSSEITSLSLPDIKACSRSEKEIVITRDDLERLLKDNNYYETIHRTIEKALSAARLRGYDYDGISHVLMVGGGSLIPSVLDQIMERFDHGRVLCYHPREVIATGAARCPHDDCGRKVVPRDYALRYWDPASRQHLYRYIVRRGTLYPTKSEVSRILVTASYDGQTHLGLALYALGDDAVSDTLRDVELVSDPKGSLHRLEQTEQPHPPVSEWINERSPTLLTATPPARRGDVRFELAFRIDTAGHLRVSARDVLSGQYVLENHSLAILTLKNEGI